MDGFKTIELLLSWTGQCVWAQSINAALSGLENRIFCNQWPKSDQGNDISRIDPTHFELYYSDDFFNKKSSVTLAGGIPVLGLSPDWLVGVIMSSSGFQLVSCKDGSTFVQGVFNNANPGSGSKVGFSIDIGIFSVRIYE
jgi:hypothetical protein